MKYFVSYRTSSGFGRCSVTRDKPILDIPDIESIEDGLRLSNGENQIAILNWREFHSISQPQENLADSSQAVQQTQSKIVRVLNKWLYPETRGDIMDLTHETKLLVEQLSAVE